MSKRGVKNSLTKDYILSKVSQEMIASKYCKIPLSEVLNCIQENTLICSPLRVDDHPTFGIQFNNKQKLKLQDFNGSFFGDVFDLVAYVLSFQTGRQINVSLKADFYYVLKHIAFTFRDMIDGVAVDENNERLLEFTIDKIKSSKAIIEVAARAFNASDKAIWAKWGISLAYLNTHFVVPVDQYYINRYCQPEPKYYYKANDPCYAYVLGMNSSGIYNIKLYFPLRDRGKGEIKFITNCNCLEGVINLDRDDYDLIVITKSTKDRMSIGCHIDSMRSSTGEGLNMGVINLPSEVYKLRNNEYVFLKSKLKENGSIISFLDFDKTGRLGAKYLLETYQIAYIFITNGEFGLANYESKDFSELKEKYSNQTINEFILETINKFNNGDI